MLEVTGRSVAGFHDEKLADAHWPAAEPAGTGVWRLDNTLLWTEEDKARRTDADAACIR